MSTRASPGLVSSMFTAWKATSQGRLVLMVVSSGFLMTTARAVVLRSAHKKRVRAKDSQDAAAAQTRAAAESAAETAAETAAESAAETAAESAAAGGPQAGETKDGVEDPASDDAITATATTATTAETLPAAMTWKSFLRLALEGSLLTSEARRAALLLAGSIVAKVAGSIKVSQQIGVMGRLLTARDWPKLFEAQASFALWCLPAAAAAALVSYSTTRLSLALRSRLVDVLQARYMAASPLRVAAQVPHPNHRLTVDVEKFAEEAAALFAGLFRPAVEVTVLTATLSRMMGARQLLQFYSFFFVAGGWVRYVQPSLARLRADAEGKGADLAAHHAAVVEFAEPMEMMGGAEAELEGLREAYDGVRRAEEALQREKLFGDTVNSYTVRYWGILAAYIAMQVTARERERERERGRERERERQSVR